MSMRYRMPLRCAPCARAWCARGATRLVAAHEPKNMRGVRVDRAPSEERDLLNQIRCTRGITGLLARRRFGIGQATCDHAAAARDHLPVPAAIAARHDAKLNSSVRVVTYSVAAHGPPPDCSPRDRPECCRWPRIRYIGRPAGPVRVQTTRSPPRFAFLARIACKSFASRKPLSLALALGPLCAPQTHKPEAGFTRGNMREKFREPGNQNVRSRWFPAPMHEGDRYRTFAEVRERLAQRDEPKEHRASLMEMAERWRESAEAAGAATAVT